MMIHTSAGNAGAELVANTSGNKDAINRHHLGVLARAFQNKPRFGNDDRARPKQIRQHVNRKTEIDDLVDLGKVNVIVQVGVVIVAHSHEPCGSFASFQNLKAKHYLCLFGIYHAFNRTHTLPKAQNFPLLFASAYSQEAGTALNEASASGLIATSRILRSALDLWLAQHQWLTKQGFSNLDATKYLLEAKSAQPQPQPFPSPFAQQPPMNGGQRANT
jgi:hypothetical protein